MRLVLALLLASAAVVPAQVTVLSHATLIDGSGNPPIHDATLVMANGHIAAMGPAAKIKTPDGAQVIDLSGKTIIPGIFNLHSHLDPPVPARLRTYAQYGITSTIGMGGDGDEVLKIRDAQRHGDIRGARIYTVLTRFEFEKDARTPKKPAPKSTSYAGAEPTPSRSSSTTAAIPSPNLSPKFSSPSSTRPTNTASRPWRTNIITTMRNS